ncbi:MAG TPA: UPF0158 family protein [Ilumatobacter sp.]|nr:UPF0158 family protein [Ilumatobacter sp.]
MGDATWGTGPGQRPVREIDLAGISEALGDASGDTEWWYDPASGQVEPHLPRWTRLEVGDEDDDRPFDRGLVRIEPEGSRPAYRDMEHFADAVADSHAADLLAQALGGRGAFRRFRDALSELPDLRSRWHDFAVAASEARAIDWLVEEGHADPDDATTERSEREAIIAETLDALGSSGAFEIDAHEMPTLWQDVTEAIDADNTVTVVRDGRPWATITRLNGPRPS